MHHVSQAKLLSIFSALIGIATLTLSGCAVSAPVPSTNALVSPLSSPVKAESKADLPLSTPASGTGNIIGVLIPGPNRHPDFIISGDLQLGNFIRADQPGNPPAISLDPAAAPQAIVDNATGKFYFTNINPGQYALIIYSPAGGSYVIKSASGGPLAVNVVSDQTTDLGNIQLP